MAGKKKATRNWKILLGIAILVVIIIAAAVYLLTKTAKIDNSLDYLVYKQLCSQNSSYFENSCMVGNNVNYTCVRDARAASNCQKQDVKQLNSDDFENLDLGCKCVEYNKRSCEEGWNLIGDYCYKGKDFTYSLMSCTFYKCNQDYFAEVKW